MVAATERCCLLCAKSMRSGCGGGTFDKCRARSVVFVADARRVRIFGLTGQ